MEYKQFSLDIKALDDEPGVIEGHASMFGNVDAWSEVVVAGAFVKTLKENPTPPILWQHDSWEPIGITVEAAEDKRGLKVRGQLALGVTRAREAYELVKAGIVRGLSIGFRTIKDEIDREKGIRYLKEIRLFEWSIVTFPANDKARITGVKSGYELSQVLEMLSDVDPERVRETVSQPLLTKAIDRLTALSTQEPGQPTPGVVEPPEAHAEPDTLLHSLADLMREYPTIYPKRSAA